MGSGIYLGQQFRKRLCKEQIWLCKTKLSLVLTTWVGKAFQIFKGNTLNDRTTNLIILADF
jgi:hypothetical protein